MRVWAPIIACFVAPENVGSSTSQVCSKRVPLFQPNGRARFLFHICTAKTHRSLSPQHSRAAAPADIASSGHCGLLRFEFASFDSCWLAGHWPGPREQLFNTQHLGKSPWDTGPFLTCAITVSGVKVPALVQFYGTRACWPTSLETVAVCHC